MIVTALSLSLCALIISVITFAFGVFFFIEFKAMQKSTHQIQMVPVDEFGKVQSELQKVTKTDQMEDDLDNII